MPSLSPTFTIGLLGSVIGLIGTLAAVYFGYRLNRQKEQAKLRKALRAEIESTKWLTEDTLPEIEAALDERAVTHDYFPTEVYNANLGNLGLLDDDEIEHVIRYYNLAQIASIQVHNIYEGDNGVTEFVEHTLGNLVTRRREVLSALKES